MITTFTIGFGSVDIDWGGAQSMPGGLRFPHLRNLKVREECRRQGYGEKVVRFALSQIRGPVTTGVVVTNDAAIKLFKKVGFRPAFIHNDDAKGRVVIFITSNKKGE